MKIVVLDNYDSFTYNVVQLLRDSSTAEIHVFRNDEITLDQVAHYDKIVLSPGPGLPKEAGILCPLIERYKGKIPILGICLGMQAIAEVFGGKLTNMKRPLHGVSTPISQHSPLLLKGLPTEFNAGRYHSWRVEEKLFPPELQITAVDADGQIMAIEQPDLRVFGVQFHPESILTDHGKAILTNFLNAS